MKSRSRDGLAAKGLLQVADAKRWKTRASNVRIGFGFTSDWMKNWRKFFKPIM